jgi:SAM-dependent methyltransferase
MSGFVPGLASLEAASSAVTEAALGGPPARALDLGGGPGVLAERLAARWPMARVGLLDLDPVLLALAQAGVPNDVAVYAGDLARPSWPAAVAQHAPADLVTVMMTIHYLSPDQAGALYRDARSVVRPGGLLIVADLMPDGGIPAVMSASYPVAAEAAAGLAWARWWDEIEAEPLLEPWMRERRVVFGDRPAAEFTPDARWHRDAARAAGFREAGVIWRWGPYAAVGAVA